MGGGGERGRDGRKGEEMEGRRIGGKRREGWEENTEKCELKHKRKKQK